MFEDFDLIVNNFYKNCDDAVLGLWQEVNKDGKSLLLQEEVSPSNE